MANEWDVLLPRTTIRLDREELLVIDVHLCAHYLANVSRGADIGEIIATWGEFRKQIWQAIDKLDVPETDKDLPVLPVSMDESTAKYLFNWLPPSFMFGTGRDCGYSLKIKLNRWLHGEPEIREVKDANQDGAESSPKDTAFTGA